MVDRQKLTDDFRKQALLVFQQWETDLEKTRENEEKLQVIAVRLTLIIKLVVLLSIVVLIRGLRIEVHIMPILVGVKVISRSQTCCYLW